MRFSAALMPLYVFMLALTIYLMTGAPTIGWGDSADLALRVVDNDGRFDGTSRDYVIYREFAGFLTSLPINADRIANVFTGICGALTVALIYLLLRSVSGGVSSAVIGAFSLLVCHTFWFLSATAEVYTFNIFIIVCAWFFLEKFFRSEKIRFLYLTAVFCGAASSHHASGIVLTTIVFFALLYKHRLTIARQLIVFIGIWFVFSVLYWLRIIDDFDSSRSMLQNFGLKGPENLNFSPQPAAEVIKLIGFMGYNFVGISGVLAIFGLVRFFLLPNLIGFVILIWTLLFLISGVFSSIPDKFNIYVMSTPGIAYFVGIGFSQLGLFVRLSRSIKLVSVVSVLIVPPLTYAGTAWFCQSNGFDPVGARVAPHRDNTNYFLLPWKSGDYGPRVFSEQTLSSLPKDSILIADYSLLRPLEYVNLIENYRPDVKILFAEKILAEGFESWLDNNYAEGSIFIAANLPRDYYGLDGLTKYAAVHHAHSVYVISRL